MEAPRSRRRAAVAVAVMLVLLVVAIGVSRLVSADRETAATGGLSDPSPTSVAPAQVGTTTAAGVTTIVLPSTEAPRRRPRRRRQSGRPLSRPIRPLY